MSGINKIILLGRLGSIPELQTTQTGVSICTFSMATSRKKKDGQEITQWHRCKAFLKTGELIAQYVKKGDQLYIEGEINYGEYEKDGIKRYTTDIIVREMSFIGGGQKNQDHGQQGYQQQGQQGGYQTQPPPQQQQYQQQAQPPQTGYYNQNQGYQPPPMTQGQQQYQGQQGQGQPPKDDIPF